MFASLSSKHIRSAELKKTNVASQKIGTVSSFRSCSVVAFLLVLCSPLCDLLECQAWSSTQSKHATASGGRLGLLSFDLDDTLFPTSTVVREANTAMLLRMKALGCVGLSEDEFFQTTRAIRQGLSKPITYTELRIRAIAEELVKAGVSKDDSGPLSVECFDIWLKERQESANRHLFPDVVDTLQVLKTTYPSVCIAAITNGRGNPREMEKLRDIFDFCVSGEDDDVFPERKPEPGIYRKALQRYRGLVSDAVEESLWVHVGDCIVNDVGAAAVLGAKTVWKIDEDTAHKFSSEVKDKQPKWSTATSEDLEERERLAARASEKVSIRISEIRELPDAIESLLAGASPAARS